MIMIIVILIRTMIVIITVIMMIITKSQKSEHPSVQIHDLRQYLEEPGRASHP